jgi:hypothetical protein
LGVKRGPIIPDEQRRTKVVITYVNPRELAALVEAVAAAGITRAEFIRRRILEPR